MWQKTDYKMWQVLQVRQNLLQSVAGITKCAKKLLQSDSYYSVRQHRQ